MRWRILLLAIGVLAWPAGAALLVHLPFDRDGTDASGSRHHAQPHNSAAMDAQHFRLGGGAARFDGVSGFFSIPAFTPAISNHVRSAAFWACSGAALDFDPNKIFLGWGGVGTEIGVRFDVCLENGDPAQLRVEFNQRFVVSEGRPINLGDGKWHHLAITYDGSAMRFYVDGAPHGEPVEVGAPPRTEGTPVGTVIGAGAREGSGTQGKQARFFHGQLDDVGIWDTVLSAEEVKLIFALAAVGDNDLRCLEPARQLWQQPVGARARINGNTWRRVNGLNGKAGDWMQVLEPNGAGSFIVLDDRGGGLQLAPHWWEGQLSQSVGLTLAVLGSAALLAWLVGRVRWRVQMRRVEARERMEAERRRIAQDLHDELGSGLTEIMLLGDLATKESLSPAELSGRLAAITSKIRDLVAAVDEVVWTANPVNDILPRLADYLGTYTEHFLRAKGIACRIDMTEGLPKAPINAKARHHLLLAVKEALNNAVKHSNATEVWLRIDCAGEDLRVTVEDNGRGFDPRTVRQGNGLTNLHSRLKELGGRTEIDSQPGRGTRVRFMLSMKNAAN